MRVLTYSTVSPDHSENESKLLHNKKSLFKSFSRRKNMFLLFPEKALKKFRMDFRVFSVKNN